MCPKIGDKIKISVLELSFFFQSRFNDARITPKISLFQTDYMNGAG